VAPIGVNVDNTPNQNHSEISLLSQYVELVKREKWDEDFVRWSFIAFLGALLGRRVFAKSGMEYEYPTLYIMFVGPPASKKSSVAKAPVSIFSKLLHHELNLSPDIMTPAAWLVSLLKYSDGSTDKLQTPIFMLVKEFITILRDIGGGSPLDLLLALYDTRLPGEPFEKHTISGGHITIPNPAVTVLGCTTRDALMETKLLQVGNTGFLSRFLPVFRDTSVRGVYKRPELDTILVNKMLPRLQWIASLRGEVKIHPSADKVLEEKFDLIAEETETENRLFESEFLARKFPHVVKVSMILALSKGRMEILPQDVEEAYAMVSDLKRSVMNLFPTKDFNMLPRLMRGREKVELKILIEESVQRNFFPDFSVATKLVMSAIGIVLERFTEGEKIFVRLVKKV